MTTIAFTGDIAFSQCFRDASRESVADDAILSFLRGAAYVVANIEGPVTDRSIDSEWRLNHANPTGAVERFREMHLNVWNLSNNHILDCGFDGVWDSIRVAESCGCVPLGIGRTRTEEPEPILLGDGDCRVGLVSATVDCRRTFVDQGWIVTMDNPERIQARIHALKARADFIVVVAHAGSEYASMPLPSEREQYMQFLKWGADVVVAHHPHVVQNYEKVGDKLLFYSLGNFIFDTPIQRQFRYTDGGILLRLTFSPAGIDWTYLATRVDRSSQRIRAAGPVGKAAPAIFQEIGAVEYALLWPLAARVYRQNCRKKLMLLPPRNAPPPISRGRLLASKVMLLRYREKRQMLYGRLAEAMKIHRLSRHPEIVRYLMGGLPGSD